MPLGSSLSFFFFISTDAPGYFASVGDLDVVPDVELHLVEKETGSSKQEGEERDEGEAKVGREVNEG